MDEKMTYKLTVRLFRDGKCFGPGIAELLRRVDATHSLRAASLGMGMAYSKAWRIMKETEAQLGFRLLHSTTGGHNGGGAELTAEGRAMLEKYEVFLRALQSEADKQLEWIFGN